jgi:SSS family solute:Na+ symporter
VLSAKNLSNAQSGTILAGFLKILPVFILILPGIIAFYISDGTVSGDRTYAWLVTNLLPSGLKGLVVAGLLAALMSSLSAMFNSTSTLLTIDIYKKIRPDADEKSTVAFGRIATGVMVLLGLLWIPFIGILSDDRMYVYLQSVQAYISPPIAAIFLFGIFWKRVNGKGAMASLITGLVLGSFRLIIEIQNKIDPLSNSFLQSIASINFLHFAIFLFIVSSAVLVLVSLSTAKPTADKLEGMIYSRNISVIKDKWRSINVGFSILLLIVLIALWWNFR